MAATYSCSSSISDELDFTPAHYEIRKGASPRFFDGFLSAPFEEDVSFELTPTKEKIRFDLRDALTSDGTKTDAVTFSIGNCSFSSSEDSEQTIRPGFARLDIGTSSSTSSEEDSDDDQTFYDSPITHPFDNGLDDENTTFINIVEASDAQTTGPTILEFGGVKYTLHGVLGRGSFGQVVYALTSLGEQVAIKICNKSAAGCSPSMLYQVVMNERNILVKTAGGDHPFLTQPLACFQDEDNVYFVMRMYAQNLAQVICSDSPPLTPKQIKLFAAELLLGLESLHKIGVVHRDLKPDNILITSNGHLAVADFGLSQLFARGVRPEMKMFESWGTFGYLAPEILADTLASEGYTGAIDIWGYGIILYEMLLGKRCIDANTLDGQELMNRQLPDFIHDDIDTHVWKKDKIVADLLHKILQLDASSRLSWAAIRQHEYFADVDWDAVKAREIKGDILAPMLENLKPYQPQVVLDGEKFTVRDCFLDFESDVLVDAVHGTTLVR